MKKITVIMPVYNVEKYLSKAIDSVLYQTYQNLEIILVDDGATDGSGRICDEYAKKDSRIKVVHQENKSLSGARNTGLELATGKFIMFIDSDDIFPQDACEKMLNYIETKDADYVVGNYTNMSEDGVIWDSPIFDTNKYVEYKLSIEDYTHSFYTMNSGVWNKIFRKSFLDKLKIKFIEGLPAEDAIFTTYCFMKAENVYYTPEIVYHYRLRNSDSISSSHSKKYFLGINKAYRIIYQNFKENNYLDFYRFFYAKSMNYILYKFIDSDQLTKEERIEILGQMKWFYMLSNDLKIPTTMKSVQYIIESISNKDYEQALKYCDLLNQVRKNLPQSIREQMSKPSASTYREIEKSKMNSQLLEIKAHLLQEMKKSNITILGIEESINKIKNERKSIARFGDGELDLITGGQIKFQEYNKELCKRLEEILKSKQNFCLIGVPDVINEFNNLTEESEIFWINNMNRTRDIWLKYLDESMNYCTANLTRLYIRHQDRSNCGRYFSMLKDIWKDRDVVICEGEQTRIGIGNDLLNECKSIKRIICPPEDAFNKYNEIFTALKKEDKSALIIIALGPTATVLAYDLAKEGYQALDIGHFDIEYEWYLRHADKKEKIENKYTNEVEKGNETEDINDLKYKEQIKTIIQ